MGQDKADVVLGNYTMLEHVTNALRDVTDHLVLLGPERSGYECWPDEQFGGGPLSGLATALSRHAGSHVLLVAVDQPLIRPETVKAMLDLADEIPVVPVDSSGVRQVTCAVYPTATGVIAAGEVEAGGSVQSFLDATSFAPVSPDVWGNWGEDGRSWFSVDTPDDLAVAKTRFNL